MFRIDKRHYREFGNIVGKDIYRVRKWVPNAFDFIVDIGAHVGIFSMMMRVMQPNAKIVAIEPARDALAYLYPTSEIFSFSVVDKALGLGTPLYYRSRGSSIDGLFTPYASDGYKVESITLSDIFYEFGISSTGIYMVKLDCEGGERYLMGDREAEKILVDAMQVSMEVHFRSKSTPFEFWPEWNDIDEWVRDIFTYHHVEYYRSNRRRGFGHYWIVPK